MGWRVRRRERKFLFLAIVAIMGVAAVALTMRSDENEPPRTDTPKVALPPLEAPASTVVEYLRGDGAVLVHFVRATDGLRGLDPADPGSHERCQNLLEAELAATAAPPRELAIVASGVPDADTGHMFTNDLFAVVDLLTACLAGSTEPRWAADLSFARRVLQQRLEELGIR